MESHVKDDFPMFFDPLDDGDAERLADERLRRMFEGPVSPELGIVEARQGHSHALVQHVLDKIVNGKSEK